LIERIGGATAPSSMGFLTAVSVTGSGLTSFSRKSSSSSSRARAAHGSAAMRSSVTVNPSGTRRAIIRTGFTTYS